jgi:hypothetical protein
MKTAFLASTRSVPCAVHIIYADCGLAQAPIVTSPGYGCRCGRRFSRCWRRSRSNVLWAILLLPLVVYVIRREVIGREERYLERTFGEEYLDYKRGVRRWV